MFILEEESAPIRIDMFHRWRHSFAVTFLLSGQVNPSHSSTEPLVFSFSFYPFGTRDWHWKLGSWVRAGTEEAQADRMVWCQSLAISRCHCGIRMVGVWNPETDLVLFLLLWDMTLWCSPLVYSVELPFFFFYHSVGLSLFSVHVH